MHLSFQILELIFKFFVQNLLMYCGVFTSPDMIFQTYTTDLSKEEGWIASYYTLALEKASCFIHIYPKGQHPSTH